jgi:type I site-specific restriction endonuclease
MVHNHPRALAQMATGSGKTFMAANLAYRLVQTAGAERVLFLVDRANLGRQTLREFQQFATPGDGRRFTDLYNVQLFNSNRIDPAARVVITTVQRLFSMLRGEEELPEDVDEKSGCRAGAGPAGRGHLRPGDPDRSVRRRDRRRVPPVDLRRVAPGHRVLRCLPRRAHRHARRSRRSGSSTRTWSSSTATPKQSPTV